MKRATIALGAFVTLCLGLFAATHEASAYSQRGVASYYCCYFHGRTTANGERFNQNAMTAAHKYLPFGTRVRVTNLRSGRSIVVRINDRGPYVGGRIIDLSRGAARALGMGGTASVRVDVIGGGKRTLVAGKRVKSKTQLASLRSKSRVRLASARTKSGKTVRVASYSKRKAARIACLCEEEGDPPRFVVEEEGNCGAAGQGRQGGNKVASMKKRVTKYATGFVKKKKPASQPIIDLESEETDE